MIYSLMLMIFIACVSSQNLVAQDSIDRINSIIEDKTPTRIPHDSLINQTLSQGDTSLPIKSKISARPKNRNRIKILPKAQQIDPGSDNVEYDIVDRSMAFFLLGILIVMLYFFIRFLIAKILETHHKTRSFAECPDYIKVFKYHKLVVYLSIN